MNRTGSMLCGVCRTVTPLMLMDGHHITPQSVGLFPDNSDDNMVMLCRGCHQSLHTFGGLISHGKSVQALDLAQDIMPNQGSVKRIMDLANHVAAEMIAMREGERDLPAIVSVQVDVPREVFVALRLMSLENMGPRQFGPFLRNVLVQMSKKAEGRNGEDIPDMVHKDIT